MARTILLAWLALASSAGAQCQHEYFLVQATPQKAPPGATITIQAQNLTTCLLTLPTDCLVLNVRAGSPAGPVVFQYPCNAVQTDFPFGTGMSATWDQKDNNGVQVPDGTYYFEVTAVDQFGSTLHAAPAVEIDSCPEPENFGPASPGKWGLEPALFTAGGKPELGNADFRIVAVGGFGGAPYALILGFFPASVTGPFGTLLVDVAQPHLMLTGTLCCLPNTTSQLILPLPIPQDASLIALDLYSQILIGDPASTGGISHSPGLHIQICP